MWFKDVINDDIETFINEEEFAETHNLNGTVCTAIIQDIVIDEDLTVSNKDYGYGAYGYGALINVRKNKLPRVPKFGTAWTVDGKIGEIVNVADDMGVLTITWKVNDI